MASSKDDNSNTEVSDTNESNNESKDINCNIDNSPRNNSKNTDKANDENCEKESQSSRHSVIDETAKRHNERSSSSESLSSNVQSGAEYLSTVKESKSSPVEDRSTIFQERSINKGNLSI